MNETLDVQPVPWSFLAVLVAFLLYGLWPALKPGHFWETSLRYTRPRLLRRFVAPVELIRPFGILWVVLCGILLLLGIGSRL